MSTPPTGSASGSHAGHGAAGEHIALPQRTRWRGWPPWLWALLVLGALVGAGVVLLFSLLIGLGGASSCNDPAEPERVASAQRGLAVLAAVALAPWLVAAVWMRPRARVVVAGLVCASPAVISVVNGAINSDAYRLGWCF